MLSLYVYVNVQDIPNQQMNLIALHGFVLIFIWVLKCGQVLETLVIPTIFWPTHIHITADQ